MPTARASAGAGNPNAAMVHNVPEAASSGRRVAPAPPGQVSFWDSHCGMVRKDGSRCTNKPANGSDVCLGHLRVLHG